MTQDEFAQIIRERTGKELIKFGEFKFIFYGNGEINSMNPLSKELCEDIHRIWSEMAYSPKWGVFKYENKEKSLQLIDEINNSDELNTFIKLRVRNWIATNFSINGHALISIAFNESDRANMSGNFSTSYSWETKEYRALALDGVPRKYTLYYTDEINLFSKVITHVNNIRITQ